MSVCIYMLCAKDGLGQSEYICLYYYFRHVRQTRDINVNVVDLVVTSEEGFHSFLLCLLHSCLLAFDIHIFAVITVYALCVCGYEL